MSTGGARGERAEWFVLEDTTVPPDEVGEMRNNGGDLVFKDQFGAFNPRSAGGGITPEQHAALRQLIHFISEGPAETFASGAYKETLPAADPFPTSVIWWTSVAKLHKIVEMTITRNPNKSASVVVWKVYSAADVLLATVTDTISYSGPHETSRTRAIA